MELKMEVWDTSRILKMVVRQASPPVDAYGRSSQALFAAALM
jgi:hypothetical protein